MEIKIITLIIEFLLLLIIIRDRHIYIYINIIINNRIFV